MLCVAAVRVCCVLCVVCVCLMVARCVRVCLSLDVKCCRVLLAVVVIRGLLFWLALLDVCCRRLSLLVL